MQVGQKKEVRLLLGGKGSKKENLIWCSRVNNVVTGQKQSLRDLFYTMNFVCS